jgi:Fe-S-cluster-containing hydrogenase component 2
MMISVSSILNQNSPWESLKAGNWFKLICGASFQDLPAVRSLALAYTLAGADCIDVAADPAVVAAVVEGVKVADSLAHTARNRGFTLTSRPWIMVSLNAGEDPHFRKAQFDPTECPPDCPRPCEGICPVKAIHFSGESSGVIAQRCYGCGRCLPVCPQKLIVTRPYSPTPETIAPLIADGVVAAIEIHTQVGQESDFRQLWQQIAPWSDSLKLLAISCPDGPTVIEYLQSLYEIVSPLSCPLIWQADGRPMSGDLGRGTTHAAGKLAQKLLAAGLPGYVQLAGGTNDYTVTKLRSLGLIRQQPLIEPTVPTVAGIAYGSYARSLLSPILAILETNHQNLNIDQTFSLQLEDHPDLLWQAVSLAQALVAQLKDTG